MITIGQLAKAAGVSVAAVRYYEHQGILPEPERHGLRRTYDARSLRRLRMVMAARDAGFGIAELRALSQAIRSGESRGLEAVAAKIREIDGQITELGAIRSRLTHAARCACLDIETCSWASPS